MSIVLIGATAEGGPLSHLSRRKRFGKYSKLHGYDSSWSIGIKSSQGHVTSRAGRWPHVLLSVSTGVVLIAVVHCSRQCAPITHVPGTQQFDYRDRIRWKAVCISVRSIDSCNHLAPFLRGAGDKAHLVPSMHHEVTLHE